MQAFHGFQLTADIWAANDTLTYVVSKRVCTGHSMLLRTCDWRAYSFCHVHLLEACLNVNAIPAVQAADSAAAATSQTILQQQMSDVCIIISLVVA